MSSFRIALVQPITVPPADDAVNVAAAVDGIAPRGARGRRFRLFSRELSRAVAYAGAV